VVSIHVRLNQNRQDHKLKVEVLRKKEKILTKKNDIVGFLEAKSNPIRRALNIM
jgi:hypothetical protein